MRLRTITRQRRDGVGVEVDTPDRVVVGIRDQQRVVMQRQSAWVVEGGACALAVAQRRITSAPRPHDLARCTRHIDADFEDAMVAGVGHVERAFRGNQEP